MDINIAYIILPLLIGWIADRLFGDPSFLPHPVVGFGKLIAFGERLLNKGNHKKIKGAIFSITLILASFFVVWFLLKYFKPFSPYFSIAVSSILIYFCLAGKTLADEVRAVFTALDESLEKGRKQVARIVGRDTSALSAQQIRTAALETLAENLSDGVIAPLFWLMLLGVPGMFAYKMVNTLDSMIGYKSERYKEFGCWAARIDDVANYFPARISAMLMIFISGKASVFSFVKKYARQHASPNSGYPEAALSGILDCRFGGPNNYFGKLVEKPYIGTNNRELTSHDMEIGIKVNQGAEASMVLLVVAFVLIVKFLLTII